MPVRKLLRLLLYEGGSEMKKAKIKIGSNYLTCLGAKVRGSGAVLATYHLR